MDQGQKYKVQLSLTDSNDARIIAYHFVRNGTSILDVGCACGDFGFLLAANKHCCVYGFEYAADSIVHAIQTGAYQRIEQTDLNFYETDRHPEWDGFFDCITFLDVLEHLVDPRDCLVKLMSFLKPNGDVIISLPNLAFGDIKLKLMNDEFTYSTTGILDSTHLRFFTYKSIAGFLAKSGLVVIDVGFKLSGLDSNLKSVVNRDLLGHVTGDPHSFVYQYVMKCTRSDLPIEELESTNKAMLNVALEDIRPRLFLIGAKRIMSTILPPGSIGRRILKNTVAMFRSGKN